MSSVELRPRVVVLSVALVLPYGLCGMLFRELNPVRWMALEYLVFVGFLAASLLSTVVLTEP